jgi:Flp pilus assembly protein TadD
MLLGANEHKPNDLAREIYEKKPDDPYVASTYAYSLYLQKKTAEALQVMRKLDPKKLEDPSIAGYYGLILAASGEKAEAKKYFSLFKVKGSPLPEETELFRRSESGL